MMYSVDTCVHTLYMYICISIQCIYIVHVYYCMTSILSQVSNKVNFSHLSHIHLHVHVLVYSVQCTHLLLFVCANLKAYQCCDITDVLLHQHENVHVSVLLTTSKIE